MSIEIFNGEGVVPSHIFIPKDNGFEVYAVGELIDEYKSNGYDHDKISETAYFLAAERRQKGKHVSNDKNWSDAERIVAINNLLGSSE